MGLLSVLGQRSKVKATLAVGASGQDPSSLRGVLLSPLPPWSRPAFLPVQTWGSPCGRLTPLSRVQDRPHSERPTFHLS